MKRRAGLICMEIGTVLIILALFLFLYNKWEAARAQKASEEVAVLLEDEIDDGDDDSSAGLDGNEYIGILTISRYGLELPVMSEWSYAGLKIAPGRYSGSVEGNDLVICGHNYERHFGNLKNLETGDEIIFTEIDGNETCYQVNEVVILQPTDVEEMVSRKDGEWDLTLFTCTLGGQARVTVRCTKAD